MYSSRAVPGLQRSTGFPACCAAPGTLAPALMEEIVDSPRHIGVDAGDLHQIASRGALDRLECSKMSQQRALAGRPNTLDLLQPGLTDVAAPPRAVRADREPVRLVAQPLDEIEHRIARRQLER